MKEKIWKYVRFEHSVKDQDGNLVCVLPLNERVREDGILISAAPELETKACRLVDALAAPFPFTKKNMSEVSEAYLDLKLWLEEIDLGCRGDGE